MRHLDLSFDGRRLSDKGQPDNGIRPHGGYRGSKRHPMCHFSFDKGREFQHKMEEEIERLILSNELALHGNSPSWSLAVHREASYTDESPLLTNQYLAASKVAPPNGVTLNNRSSLLPPKKGFKPQKRENTQFYRPNSTHQYLSATELKNASEGDVNPLYGRPTRTTLLRARQRCTSAPLNNQTKRRESDPKIDDYRSCYSVPSNTENLQLDKDGETLHSFLTGARYNRAHCLDARSVDHSGVYMPRNNTAMGCFFTGPKGHEYLKEFEETTPRSESVPSPRLPPPSSPKRRRPTTAPGHGNRSITSRPVAAVTSPPSPPSRMRRHAWELPANGPTSSRYKTLNVVGCRLPIGMNKDLALRLPNLQPLPAPRKPLEETTYRGYQPPPTPTSMQPPSQGFPTDRLLGAEGTAELQPELDNVGTPVTQVVVTSNGGDDIDDADVDKMMVAMIVEAEKKEEVEELVGGDDNVKEEEEEVVTQGGEIGEEKDEIEEKKTEEELKDDEVKETEEEREEEENEMKEEEVVEEKEELKEETEEKKESGVVGEEEEKEEEEKVDDKEEKNDELVDDNDNVKEKNNDEEDNYYEEDVEEFEEDEKEEEKEMNEEEDKPQKEVRFFITEKDKEDAEEDEKDGVETDKNFDVDAANDNVDDFDDEKKEEKINEEEAANEGVVVEDKGEEAGLAEVEGGGEEDGGGQQTIQEEDFPEEADTNVDVDVVVQGDDRIVGEEQQEES